MTLHFLQARELIRQFVVFDQRWETDNTFGSTDIWLGNITKYSRSTSIPPANAMTLLCRGSVRITICTEGHVQVKPKPYTPWIIVAGLEAFEDTTFEANEIGNIGALLRREALSTFRFSRDASCPMKRQGFLVQARSCRGTQVFEEDVTIQWPRIMTFYICQKDNIMFHPSKELDFPSELTVEDSPTPLRYQLQAKVYSTTSTGEHFYSKVIRHFPDVQKSGVYIYDDLRNGGKAILQSEEPGQLAQAEELCVMVMYRLVSDEETVRQYATERAGMYNGYLHSGSTPYLTINPSNKPISEVGCKTMTSSALRMHSLRQLKVRQKCSVFLSAKKDAHSNIPCQS